MRRFRILASCAVVAAFGALPIAAMAQPTMNTNAPPPAPSSPAPAAAPSAAPAATSHRAMRHHHHHHHMTEAHRGRHGRRSAGADTGPTSQDNMADQLNAQSLQRANSGQNSPSAGPDTTGSLNRMSDRDAMMGRNPPQPMMPMR